MDRTFLGSLLVLSLLGAGAASAAPAGGGAFAFTGAHLGMSLANWRALRFPGVPQGRAKPACSSDAGVSRVALLAPTPAEHKSGALVCGYVARYGDVVLPEGIRPAKGREPVQVRYVFVNSRLADIRYRAPGSAFDRVTARLKAAYGPPRAIVRDEVRTEIGRLQRVRMSWATPAGSAVLTDPDDPRLEVAVELSGQPLPAAATHN
jgi:hypothetical protein